MGLRADDRGQAVQIGAILLFGILVIGLSIYQATVVPQQNQRVEYEAYQGATADLLALQNDVGAAATRDVQTGTTVLTGARYPSRTIFVNAPPPTGSVSTADAPNVTLRGVRAIGSEPTNVREYWDAVGSDQQYETARLRFSPDYNHFDAPPVVLTGSGAYRSLDDGVVPLTGQTLISGNRITVVTLRGDVSAAGYVTPVTADPVTAATRTVTVTGDGGNFTLTVPTPTNATAWDARVGQRLVAGNPNVVSTTPHANGSATVTFNGSRQYELRLAAVELRAGSSSVVSDPGPTYLYGVTDNETAFSGKPKTLTVEVRDRYDNPVTGAPVNFSLTDGSGTLTPSVATTDDEGRARVTFTPGGNYTGSATVEARRDYDGNGTIESYERTTFDLTVLDADTLGGGGGNGDINPAESDDMVLTDATGKGNEATLTFSTPEERTVTHARISFYYTDSGSGSDKQARRWRFQQNPGQILDVGGPLTELSSNVTVSSGDPDVVLAFDDETSGYFFGSSVDTRGDFFILSVQFADGTTDTYFVAVSSGGGGGGGGGWPPWG